jgi:hypothetical protein
MTDHISISIDRLTDRGNLPLRVRVARSDATGDVLTWRPDLRGYQSDRTGGMLLAGVVRRGWGCDFFPGPAVQEELMLCSG